MNPENTLENLGHSATENHIPIPAGHAPRLETLINTDCMDEIMIRERENSEAWISGLPTEVEQ